MVRTPRGVFLFNKGLSPSPGSSYPHRDLLLSPPLVLSPRPRYIRSHPLVRTLEGKETGGRDVVVGEVGVKLPLR